jgi:hypothetical protein
MRVAALAGRRVDPADAGVERFPLAASVRVRNSLHELFETRRVDGLVCSAASGADLVALEVADVLNLRRRVVLPSPPERFRATSVVDRPGDFGPAFDRVIADLADTPDLVVLTDTQAGANPYAAANRVILDQAVALAGDPAEVLAVIVWEGRPRGAGDLTEQLANEARARGIEVVEIRTA